MALYRSHRGTLKESMATVQEVNSLQEICEKETVGLPLNPIDLVVEPYGVDHRIEWDTFIVMLKSGGVLGFTNGIIS